MGRRALLHDILEKPLLMQGEDQRGLPLRGAAGHTLGVLGAGAPVVVPAEKQGHDVGGQLFPAVLEQAQALRGGVAVNAHVEGVPLARFLGVEQVVQDLGVGRRALSRAGAAQADDAPRARRFHRADLAVQEAHGVHLPPVEHGAGPPAPQQLGVVVVILAFRPVGPLLADNHDARQLGGETRALQLFFPAPEKHEDQQNAGQQRPHRRMARPAPDGLSPLPQHHAGDHARHEDQQQEHHRLVAPGHPQAHRADLRHHPLEQPPDRERQHGHGQQEVEEIQVDGTGGRWWRGGVHGPAIPTCRRMDCQPAPRGRHPNQIALRA